MGGALVEGSASPQGASTSERRRRLTRSRCALDIYDSAMPSHLRGQNQRAQLRRFAGHTGPAAGHPAPASPPHPQQLLQARAGGGVLQQLALAGAQLGGGGEGGQGGFVEGADDEFALAGVVVDVAHGVEAGFGAGHGGAVHGQQFALQRQLHRRRIAPVHHDVPCSGQCGLGGPAMVADLDWRAVLEGFELGQGFFAWHKGADAGGDEHRGRQPRLNVVWPVVLPIAAHQPAPVGLALHAAHELTQMQRRVEGAQLLQQALGELAARHRISPAGNPGYEWSAAGQVSDRGRVPSKN